MITEIVTFPLPEGMTLDELMTNFETTAPVWKENPDLIRKHYIYNAEKRIGGGVYLWRSHEALKRWHGPAFRDKIKSLYGAEPTFQVFDALITVDPVAGTIVKEGE